MTSDLISRQDAIEAANRVNEAHMELKGTPMLGWCTLLDEIESLPSASVGTEMSLPKWIPCSERLPKEKARVLTYDTMGDIVFGQYDKGRWYWEAEACANYWAKNDGVIAWMPLPEPYREDGEA